MPEQDQGALSSLVWTSARDHLDCHVDKIVPKRGPGYGPIGLEHEGQGPVLIALIGLAGGTAMAGVMAAVTGVGVLRLSSRMRPSAGSPGSESSEAGQVVESHSCEAVDGAPTASPRDDRTRR